MRTGAFLGLLCLALAGAAAAQVRTGEQRADLQRDPRLAKPITLRERRIHVGDLLERVSAATGARIEASDRLAPISGYELTAAFHERPAWQLLDALARLYHFPPDRWYWVRERRSGVDRYLLRNSMPAAWAGALRESLAEEHLLAEYRRLRARHGAAPDGSAGSYLFTASLTPEQFLAVVRGETVRVPAAQITPAQRAFIEGIFARHNEIGRNNPAVLEGRAEATERRFEDVKELVFSRDAPPSRPKGGIRVEYGSTATTWGSMPFNQQQMRERLSRHWTTEEEERRAPDQPVPAEGARVPPVASSAPPTGVTYQRVDELLMRFAEAARLDLLFERPFDSARNPFAIPPVGMVNLTGTLPEVLGNLERRWLLWKRRGPVYLFRLADWMGIQRESAVPWPAIRELRASARAHGGYLTLDDWIRLAALAPGQQDLLAPEFPDLRFGRLEQAAALLQLAASLDAADRAAAGRPQGAAWNDLSRTAREALVRQFGRERAHEARVLLQWMPEGRTRQVRWFLGTGEPRPPQTLPLHRWRDYRPPAPAGAR